MDPALREEILSVLKGASDMTIATIRPDGYPQATTVLDAGLDRTVARTPRGARRGRRARGRGLGKIFTYGSGGGLTLPLRCYSARALLSRYAVRPRPNPR